MTGQNLMFLDQVREFVLFSLHAPSLHDWSLAVVFCGAFAKICPCCQTAWGF